MHQAVNSWSKCVFLELLPNYIHFFNLFALKILKAMDQNEIVNVPDVHFLKGASLLKENPEYHFLSLMLSKPHYFSADSILPTEFKNTLSPLDVLWEINHCKNILLRKEINTMMFIWTVWNNLCVHSALKQDVFAVCFAIKNI